MDHPYRVRSDPQEHAFPPDVTPEEIGLPTAIPALPLGVMNSVSADGISTRCTHSRHRRNRTNRGPRSENVADILREEDIADQVRGELAVLW
jgi:hypothetical protein